MTSELEQHQALINSLQVINKIFTECNAVYRIIGSILIAAHCQKIFRRLGDIDIILNTQDQPCVFKKLQNQGFTFKQRKWFIVKWFEVEKPEYLGFTFLLMGDFRQEYFSYQFWKFCELRMDNNYLSPTKYNYHGAEFIGIPLSSVITGIKKSALNPKRKLDKLMLKDQYHKINLKTSAFFNIYLGKIRIPYLCEIFSLLYNLYGGIRVRLGKKYEVW